VLAKGTTFIRHGHIWFNITEPTERNPYVLCVNFTCMDEDCPDDECPISRAEYNWVKDNYPTVIAFSRARIWDANKILKCLADGHIRKPRQGNVPPATVSKVIKVALTARELNNDLRVLL
jgi:hypothetical protein